MLPSFVEAALTALGLKVHQVAVQAGGEISATRRIETSEGAFFLKYQTGATAVPFTAEREGLEALRRAGVIRIPEVIAEGAGPDGAFLLLEMIPDAAPTDPLLFRGRFAERLAALHHVGPNDGAGYGFPTDNFIGNLPQKNLPRAERWPGFYRDCRLLPQIEIARKRERLPVERERLLEALIEVLPDRLAGMDDTVSLLHGDLWSGNFLCAPGDEPVLIDPAAYFGHREVEMAFIELFGGFPPDFREAYEQVWPFSPGYAQRRSLHQLCPLLVHLNHFGERYAPAVERVCQEYLA